ncbi:helix-turn-helix domain-containing protein [Companilactobacillus furfuricola]|uniref:helix-turn-helix domain-containing protein n=1 Tax=Companilactobacillus furfuricola TaxID=1462575 RepID=UPI000F7A8377|nr:helix-turn-helix transcriptional regulator [Companilactobacillus furfuricola]
MAMFDRIKEISKKRGLSLAQLNDKAGFKQNVIYSWKSKKPSIDKVNTVADVLHVSVDYLLGKTDDPEPSKKNKPTEVDLDDDVIMTFEGRPIPPEDIELMKRLLRGGRNDK